MDGELRKQLVGSLSKKVEPVRRSGMYKVSLLLVTCIMILLPVVYVLIIMMVGYGVHYYAIHYFRIFLPGSDSAWRFFPFYFKVLIYFGPIFIGSAIAFYMTRPLLVRRKKAAENYLYAITQSNSPDFYQFVELICKAVNAPMPKRIELGMEPDASARFRRGWLSFFSGGDLVLRVGLPLLGALNIRQLAGVIAHEMGHFSQGTGMRLSYIIDSIHGWFFVAIYGGDTFIEKLDIFEDKSEGLAQILAGFSRLFVELTKLVLWLFMMLGFVVSKFMSRQMEYDADVYQMKLSGSDTFESTFYALTLLGWSFEKSAMVSMETWKERILVDDLPMFVNKHAKSIARKNMQDVINSILVENTKVFDAHPSIRDRIAQAKKKNIAGICQITAPAKVLFADFGGLSVQLTRRIYQSFFGKRFSQGRLLPIKEYLEYSKKYEYEFS